MKSDYKEVQHSLFGSTIDCMQDIEFTDYIISKIWYLLDIKEKSIFVGSPFEGIVTSSPHARGIAGERIVSIIAKDLGMYVERSKTADLCINGVDVEVKFCRQNEDGGFIVNQIRPPQKFYCIALIVILPRYAYIFTIPKDIIVSKCHGQHGGNKSIETMIYKARTFHTLSNDFGEYNGISKFTETINLFQKSL